MFETSEFFYSPQKKREYNLLNITKNNFECEKNKINPKFIYNSVFKCNFFSIIVEYY